MADERLPWLVIALSWLGWLSIMLPWNVISPILSVIEDEYHVSHAQAGWLMSGFNLSYALMQVPAGILCDRFGKKKQLTISVLGASLPAFLTIFVRSFEQILVLRIIVGLFSGLWYAPITALISENTGGGNRGKAIGLSVTSAPFSRVLLFTVTSIFTGIVQNWRLLFLFSAIPGFVSTLLLIVLIKKEVEVRDIKKGSLNEAFLKMFRKTSFIYISMFIFFSWLLFYALSTFSPTYYVKERNLTISETASLFILNSVTMIFCSPLAGYLNDRFGYEVPFLFSTILMAAVVYLIPIIPLGIPTIVAIAIWGIIGMGVGPIVSVLVSKISPPNIRGTSLGIVNLVGFLGATIGPAVFGYVADTMGFSLFFILMFISYILSTFLIFMIRREMRKTAEII